MSLRFELLRKENSETFPNSFDTSRKERAGEYIERVTGYHLRNGMV